MPWRKSIVSHLLHLGGEDFHLQEVHGKAESCPRLKGVVEFVCKLWMFMWSAVMLQHAVSASRSVSALPRT